MNLPPTQVGRLTVRLADPLDPADLAPRLRPWDMVECFAFGHSPYEALMTPFETGNGPTTWALEQDGLLIAMGGVTEHRGEGCAAVWLLASPEIEGGGRAFLALSRAWVPYWLELYPSLRNVIPARCEQAIRWLRWLGFDFDPAFVHFQGIPFLRFRMDRKDGPRSASAP